MKREYFRLFIFAGVTILAGYLFYRMLKPFLVSLCWGAIFGIVFYPVYEKLRRWIKSDSWRAVLVTFLVLIVIIGPITYLGISLVQEAISLFDTFSDWVASGKLTALNDIKNTYVYQMLQTRLSPYIDLSHLDIQVMLEDGVKKVSSFALTQATKVLTNTGKLLFQFVLMIFFLFYFIRDGKALFDRIREVIPLPPEKAAVVVANLKKVIQSNVYGGLVVALLQGLLGGILFLIMGLPSPVFWGAVMAFLALLPVIGPFIIYIPAGIILIATGSPVKGVLLIAIGSIVVSQIDNFLRPILASRETGMHTMLLFVSIMGGAAVFGLLGIVLGPVIAAVFVTIFDIFRLKLTESNGDPPPAAIDTPPSPPESPVESNGH
ncbi:MAG: AI-2E family transporter [candidate division Zixibacteria bacterium]|nr:AI-2E family transporter [candidate division Zixibacteria bacterium]